LKDHCLGILSGIGAAAGLHMAQRLVQLAQENGAKADSDFPDFVLHNLPSEATDEKGVKDSELVLVELGRALHKLDVWGCDHLLIACNTLHYYLYLPQLQSLFRGTIINMVDLACSAAASARRVSVICSVSTRECALYRRTMHQINPVVEVSYPNEGEQMFINAAIEDAICGKKPEKYWKGFHDLCGTLRRRGADMVILGCTELPLCLRGHPLPTNVIDAGDIAVREALRLLEQKGPPRTA